MRRSLWLAAALAVGFISLTAAAWSSAFSPVLPAEEQSSISTLQVERHLVPLASSHVRSAQHLILSCAVQAKLGDADLQTFSESVVGGVRHFWDVFRPGGQLHPEAFLANKGHLAIEGILGLVLLGMLCARTAAPSGGKKLKAELTEQVWCPTA